MNIEAQRTTIAEEINRSRPKFVFDNGYGTLVYWHEGNMHPWCPERDLNAMHEAEKVLTLESGWWKRYQHQLRMVLVVSGKLVCNTAEEHRFLCATAAQRAEAFLKSIGKWEETR